MKKISLRILLYSILVIGMHLIADAQTYPIVWANPINTTPNGDNSVTKTGGISGFWDAGIVSQNVLQAGSDGYVQFVYPGVTSHVYMVTLSRLNNDPSYISCDYSMFFSYGTLYLYTGTTSLGNFGVPVANDVFKISREANVINFYKNGVVIKSIALSANQDFLRADVTIAVGSVPPVVASFKPILMVKPQFTFPGTTNNNGGIALQLENQTSATYSWSTGETTSSITGKSRAITSSYTVAVTDAQNGSMTRSYGLGYPVWWTNITNVSVNADNSLTKTDATGWTAGASSLNSLAPNADGWVEFVITDPTSTYFIGLSNVHKSVSASTMDYGWYVTVAGGIAILEMGSTKATVGSLLKGDVLRIAREGSNINYYLNGVLKRTVASSSSTQLVADVSIYDNFGPLPVVSASFDKQIRVIPSFTFPDNSNQAGSITLNVQGTYSPSTISWSGGESTNLVTSKARGKYTVTINDAALHTFSRSYQLGYPIGWTDLQNTSINANNIVFYKPPAPSGWTASAVSSNVLAPSTDGWIEFVPDAASTTMVGLARLNSVANYTSIDYAFYFQNGNAMIYELGVNRGITIGQSEGDVFGISREGSNIKYYINGVVVRTVATTVTFPLIVDTAILIGSLPLVTASFTRIPATYYALSNGAWTNTAIWSLADGGVAANFYPGSSDIVIVKGYNVVISSGIYSAGITINTTTGNTGVTVDGASSLLSVKGNVVLSGSTNTSTANALVVQNGATLSVNP